ncbi:MarR family winged helix-turn-helix transcriptional regulator [Crossiella cryophila]|uniref:DNA-binding MarR family transcriptional regulator n=1 Tax=Crossiella cryophila TaxID=43355 RepID=A0A7W7FXN3_9PSEU|nr:MarR family transcriptional regulator [Crossiella cryophila]MBB4679119.1 DNA-binding MarR family transcriptional regulator [Crossiella cryophila]
MAEGQLPVTLAMVFRLMNDRVHTRMDEQGYPGLRPAYGYAFNFLSCNPTTTAVALAIHLGVTKQAAVQLVEELENQGFVTRRPHPDDGRAKIVELTERGRQCIREVELMWMEEEERWEQLVGKQALDEVRFSLWAYVRDSGRPVGLRPLW